MIRRKYGNKKCEAEGFKFDSQRERDLFLQHRMLEKAGKITHLEHHPVYKLVVNGVKIGRFSPDFQYRELDGSLKVVDVKSPITAAETAFRIRVKLCEALYPGVKVDLIF